MKNCITTLLLLLAFIAGFSQNSGYEYKGRLAPSVNKEKLNEAKLVGDITPDLWSNMALAYGERDELVHLLEQERKTSPAQQNFVYPQTELNYPREYYAKIIDYVSVEISAICGGKVVAAVNASEALSAEQKNMLNSADPNTDISIKITFKFKKSADASAWNAGKLISGNVAVTIVPKTEAEYPGGYKQITAYLNENIFNKISEKKASEKAGQAIVKFTINEEGRIVDAKIFRTSTDPTIDNLILNATNKMPKWKPAENANGVKVKQEFIIPLSNNGC